MEENIIGTIYAVEFKSLRYNIVFTEKRLIGDYVGGTGGAFLLGGVAGMALADRHLKKKAAGITKSEIPEEILKSHKKNFSIDYLSIDEAILKKKMLILKLNQKIKKIGKKAGFLFSKKQLEDVESIVMKVLPNITTIKH